jgi:L-threonylcarbamoyladenylate synthase
VLDAGPALHGVESTVLDVSQTPMRIYRPGAITAEQIRAVAGAVELYRENEQISETPMQALPAPGVGLRHYAPRARLMLIDASAAELGFKLAEAVRAAAAACVGVMLPEGLVAAPGDFGAAVIFPWGRWNTPGTMAEWLYAGLRALDAAGCDVIVCPLPPAEGIGVALRDRLRKAAGSEGTGNRDQGTAAQGRKTVS